jgi:hypothetical protein
VTVGTIFEDSKVPLRKWLVAWYMLCTSKKGVSALQIQRMLHLGSYHTAWLMMRRIRRALSDPMFADRLSGDGGMVEADETYVGAKVKRMMRLSSQLPDDADDAVDLAVARKRLAEINLRPESVMRGAILEEKMRRWES